MNWLVFADWCEEQGDIDTATNLREVANADLDSICAFAVAGLFLNTFLKSTVKQACKAFASAGKAIGGIAEKMVQAQLALKESACEVKGGTNYASKANPKNDATDDNAP